ncbi:aminoglycoside phosphotransferase family protein [Streptomyces sp. ODS28]|uniref:aminoglycoside phosphotransferase family protein n=1 Tax=Streptomyces sp. ODS28 TaxID=3136688 RepID=UPI0031E62C2B
MHPAPPTSRTVHRLLLPVLPGLQEAEVRPVAEGGEHSTWLAGARHVARLALDAGTSRRQRTEVGLRNALAPRVSSVASSAAAGEWHPGLAYTLDTRLTGASAERRTTSPTGEAQLASLLLALRAFPAREAEALGVPVAEPRDPAAEWERAAKAAQRLGADGELGPVAESAHPLPARPFPHEAVYATTERAPGVLLHNDLKGEHLLLDEDGELTGVLDWTDAALGDPAEDLAGLAISVGARAACRVAAPTGYGPGTRARGIALSRADTLVRLADRLYHGDDSPLPLLRAQLRRAWERAEFDARPGAHP